MYKYRVNDNPTPWCIYDKDISNDENQDMKYWSKYLSTLLLIKFTGKKWRGEKSSNCSALTSAWLQWWCVKGNSTVLLYYYLFILLFPIHLSQFRETLRSRYVLYQEANVCKVSKSVKGGSGPAFRAEARENFWVMVLGTKGFPVLVEWQL